MLEARAQPYVLSERSNERLMTMESGFAARDASAITDALPPGVWHRHAAGEGAKGPRLYDWVRMRLLRLQTPPWDHWLLARRSLRDPSDRTYYVVFAPLETTLAELARVAGLRWTIKACFGTGKGELGLDHCEARSWDGWHRHMTLCTAALAFLAWLRAEQCAPLPANRTKGVQRPPRQPEPAPPRKSPDRLPPLSALEV